MPTNEEGEFELVLGNKQLLSVFFLVVLLLAVFFSMGYLAGRYSAPTTVASSGKPAEIDPPVGSTTTVAGVTQAPPPPDVTKPSPSSGPSDPKPADPPKTTTPPKPEPVKPEPPKPEPPKVVPAKPEPPKPGLPATAGPGSYLQVVATRQKEAAVLSDVLSKKGYSVRLMPVPDSDLFRVLVGPLPDAAAATKARQGLEAAGFKPIPRKI